MLRDGRLSERKLVDDVADDTAFLSYKHAEDSDAAWPVSIRWFGVKARMASGTLHVDTIHGPTTSISTRSVIASAVVIPASV